MSSRPSALLACLVLACAAWGPCPGRPSVLLILVDDLKPAIGAYGDGHAITPALDALAGRGMLFERAYCNQAVCAPSRFHLMLGTRSTTSGLYDLGSQLREVYPGAVTLPQLFSRHGYRSESLGKVFHIGHGNHGDPGSFDVPHFADAVVEYVLAESTGGGQLTREEALFSNRGVRDEHGQLRPRGAAWEAADVADEAYADGRVAAEAIRRLEAAAGRDAPFFIAVGFARPHLPFTVPKKYWDLFDPEGLPLAENRRVPEGAPGLAGKRGGEISAYAPVPEDWDGQDEALSRKLVHGYYASVSYVDAQIGKVLGGLERCGLDDDTIVVLWGDHGFHLGDHGIWTKHTNYEQATRIPLLICAPGVTRPGSSTGQLAETVDLLPTLAELAGLPLPEGAQPIDGTSLVPVLRDPGARVKDHIYHVYPRRKLGQAIRTERYRMVAWSGLGGEGSEVDYELYDYEDDPLETRNLAGERPEVLERLLGILAGHPEPARRGRAR